ncbi:MAG: 50S ribosomal protein L17 [Candidatus Zixiibacteriota bacterium]
MRHGRKVKKLGRTKSHRKAMLANMAASLFLHHTIKTTEAKAKEVKKLAEKLITLAKRGDLHSHRQVHEVIKDRKLVKQVFDEIAPKFKEREGGYTRVLKLGVRRGDGASISVVELLIEKPPKEDKKGKKEKGAKKGKPEKEEKATPKTGKAEAKSGKGEKKKEKAEEEIEGDEEAEPKES